jgi:hypothetical protein
MRLVLSPTAAALAPQRRGSTSSTCELEPGGCCHQQRPSKTGSPLASPFMSFRRDAGPQLLLLVIAVALIGLLLLLNDRSLRVALFVFIAVVYTIANLLVARRFGHGPYPWWP